MSVSVSMARNLYQTPIINEHDEGGAYHVMVVSGHDVPESVPMTPILNYT